MSKREKIISVRVSEEEYKKLEVKAKERGLTVSTLLRSVSLLSELK